MRQVIAATAIAAAIVIAAGVSVESQTSAPQTAASIDKQIADAEAEGAKYPRIKTPDPYPRKCNVIRPEQIVFPSSKPPHPDPYIWSGDFSAVSISFGWDKTYELAKMPLQVLYPDAVAGGLRIRIIRLDAPGEAAPFVLDGFNANSMANAPFYATFPRFPTPGKWMMIMTAGMNWGCFVLDRPVKS